MEFKVGETYRVGITGIKPYKIHICAIVDDNMVVFKWYGRHKQKWHYHIEEKEMVIWRIERVKINE
jgi:hypothetical protein